jgi:hypothetical protein
MKKLFAIGRIPIKAGLFLFIVYSLLLTACVSSEKALNKGQYGLAMQKAIKKLRKSPDKTKEILVLEKAFKKAQQNDFDRIAFIQKEGSPDHWDEVFSIYSRIKDRQTWIKTLPTLEVRDNNKKVIRNAQFDFVNVDDELLQAKQKAAEYFYAHGISLMQKGGRFNARDAYSDFQRVKGYYTIFKDIDDQLIRAHEAGITKVLFKMQQSTPVPLPPTFEQELLKISVQDLNQGWIKYYTRSLSGMEYDYTVIVNLKVIDVSPESVKDVQFTESKEVHDGWEYQKDAKGNVMKDSLGNDIKKPKFKTITCTVVETQFRKMAHIAGSLDYLDNHTNQLYKTDNIAADSFFEDGALTVIGGDVSALKPETKAKIGHKPAPFPNPFDMLLKAGDNLKGMVKNILYENKCILN